MQIRDVNVKARSLNTGGTEVHVYLVYILEKKFEYPYTLESNVLYKP